jgi:hypothetical protein
MKQFVSVVVVILVVAFLGTDLLQAQVTGTNGVLGINLSNAGRIRIGPSPYTSGTRHIDRITSIAGLNKDAVFDYNEDADSTSYKAQKITLAGADSVWRVLVDAEYSQKPPKVKVQVTLYGWKNAKYFVYRYRFYNDSTVTMPLYLSSFTIPMPSAAYGGESIVYNKDKKTCYYYRTGTQVYVSQKLLSKNLVSMRIMDWNDYSPDPNSDAASDSMRYAMSTYSGFDTLLAAASSDGSVFQMNAGLYTLAAKDSTDIYFGVGIGASVNEALALMDSAQVKYGKLTSVERTSLQVPATCVLEQNYPNPFNPSTLIQFSVKERGNVTLTVHDLLGRTVETLAEGLLEPGKYKAIFDGSRYPTGIYYYTIVAGNYRDTKKMLLTK